MIKTIPVASSEALFCGYCHGGLQKLLLHAVSSAPLLEVAASVGKIISEQHLCCTSSQSRAVMPSIGDMWKCSPLPYIVTQRGRVCTACGHPYVNLLQLTFLKLICWEWQPSWLVLWAGAALSAWQSSAALCIPLLSRDFLCSQLILLWFRLQFPGLSEGKAGTGNPPTKECVRNLGTSELSNTSEHSFIFFCQFLVTR